MMSKLKEDFEGAIDQIKLDMLKHFNKDMEKFKTEMKKQQEESLRDMAPVA